MKTFILLYRGPATPQEEMSEEQSTEIMAGWKMWIDDIGPALVDVGFPMANGRAIADDGTDTEATELVGYTIVQADNMDGAMQLAENHPFLAEGEGRFAIEVHELQPVPEME